MGFQIQAIFGVKIKILGKVESFKYFIWDLNVELKK